MHINNIRMLNFFQNQPFTYSIFQLIPFPNHVLFQRFDGESPPTKFILSEVHFSEAACSYDFEQIEAFEWMQRFQNGLDTTYARARVDQRALVIWRWIRWIEFSLQILDARGADYAFKPWSHRTHNFWICPIGHNRIDHFCLHGHERINGFPLWLLPLLLFLYSIAFDHWIFHFRLFQLQFVVGVVFVAQIGTIVRTSVANTHF